MELGNTDDKKDGTCSQQYQQVTRKGLKSIQFYTDQRKGADKKCFKSQVELQAFGTTVKTMLKAPELEPGSSSYSSFLLMCILEGSKQAMGHIPYACNPMYPRLLAFVQPTPG